MGCQISPQLHKLKVPDILTIIFIEKRRNRMKEVVMMYVCHHVVLGE